jgi:hypothetical protein
MSGKTNRREFLSIAAGAGAMMAMGTQLRSLRADNLDLSKGKLLHHIDCTQEFPAEKYFALGDVKVVESPIGRYREAQGTPPTSRFGYRFAIEHVGKPHVAVIRYPDDKRRYMCVMDGTGYDLTTGIYTGGVQPISGKMLELRQIFWPRWNDCSIVFMTFSQGEQAAVAGVDIYELDELPPLALPGVPGDGNRRELGIQYEDPCGTAISEGSINHAEWIDHIAKYARHSGQNLLVYPMAWYHGPQFPSRCEPSDAFDWVLAPNRKQYIRWIASPNDWFGSLLERFGKDGLQFQGSMTLMRLGSLMKAMNVDLESIQKGVDTYNNMAADNQVQTGTNDWTPIYNVMNYRAMTEECKDRKPLEPWNPGPKTLAYGEHRNNPCHMGPIFNPLHPTVQAAILAFVKDLAEQYAKYPAFKGISFNMFLTAMPWFGTIHFGYDDFSVDLFEKETGIAVPVDKAAPDRFAQRAAFLLEKHRAHWIAWRCKKIRELFGQIHKTIAAVRSDLRVTITLWDETFVPELGYSNEGKQFGTRKSLVELYREAGIDVDLYRNEPGLEIDRGMGNSRDRGGHGTTDDTVFRDGDYLEQDSIDAVHNLDKPGAFIFNCWVEEWGKTSWSSAEPDDPNVTALADMDGKKAEGVFRQNSEYPQDGFWWDSQSRITPGFQGGVHFLEPYAAALADLDACRITRGGLFLDKAHTEYLQQFAAAYRALPKQKFETVGKTTDPVAVRTLVYEGKRYFYMVNRDYYPVKVTIAFNAAPKAAENLATGQKSDLPQQWTLELGPYDLQSYAVSPDVQITGFTATPPEAIAQKLQQEAQQTLALFAKVRAAGKNVPGMDSLEARIRDAMASGKLAWLRRAIGCAVVRKCQTLGV